MKALLATFFAVTLSGQALADDLAKHNCPQPIAPNTQASDIVVKQFNKRMHKYQDCIDKFVAEQKEISKSTTDTTKANQAFEAAEVAQKEYNDFVGVVNGRNPHDDGDPGATLPTQAAPPK